MAPRKNVNRAGLRRTPARPALVAALNESARAHSTMTVLFHQAINARLGLSATEGKTLDLLTRLGPMSPGQLAERTGLAPASVTELVDRLEAKGFVQRRRDEEDRRRVLVAVVPEPLAGLDRLFARFARSTERLWRQFSDEELAVIQQYLDRGTAFMQQAIADLDAPDEGQPGDEGSTGKRGSG